MKLLFHFLLKRYSIYITFVYILLLWLKPYFCELSNGYSTYLGILNLRIN